MRWLWCFLSSCLMSPSWVMHLNNVDRAVDGFIPQRLFGIGTFAIFWCLKSYFIIITDILWSDLHLNTPVTDCMTSIVLSNCICLLPHSIWNARHAWTLALTLHSITILHWHEREHIKSVHWVCNHDVCFMIHDLHYCLKTHVFKRYKARESFL